MRVWLLAAAVLLAGCASTPSSSFPPEVESVGWTQPTAALWLVTSTGCGFCSGDPTVPEFEGVAYWRDGKALLFEYARGTGDARVEYHEESLTAFAPALEDLFTQANVYGVRADESVRIHIVASATMKDAPRLNGVFSDALADATEPKPRESDCQDCSATIMQSFGPPRADRIEMSPQWDVGDGWQRVQDQLEGIGEMTARANDW